MPPTPASIGSLSAVLKTVYDKQAEVIAFDSHPFLGRVPKTDKFGGDNHVQTVRFVGGQGVSTKFANALNNRTPNSYRKFIITRFSRYGIGSITGEAIEAARGDLFTMANGLESEIEGLFTTIGIQSAADLYRSGSGTIGRGNGGALTTTNVANDTLTLAVPSDAIHFGVGQTLGSSLTDGSALENAGTVNLVGVDMITGTLVANVAWNVGIAGFTTADYLFPDGNYSLLGATATCMPGLAAWIPQVPPGPTDSFFGVNRSVAPVELAGQRIQGNGDPREETWQNAMALCARFGAKITDGYMHPTDLAKLTISLGSQVRREEKATNTNVGYESVSISGPTGTVKVFGDPDCPEGLAYGVKLSDWELMSLGKMPRFLMLDGNRILREATADAYEYRIGYYAALRCKVPKNQISIAWLGARHEHANSLACTGKHERDGRRNAFLGLPGRHRRSHSHAHGRGGARLLGEHPGHRRLRREVRRGHGALQDSAPRLVAVAPGAHALGRHARDRRRPPVHGQSDDGPGELPGGLGPAGGHRGFRRDGHSREPSGRAHAVGLADVPQSKERVVMALMNALKGPDGEEAEEGSDEEEATESPAEESAETTKAQRMAGMAFAKAVKSGDGEAIYLAFAEMCALHADEEEGADEADWK
jgi:hypothetical protein